MGVSKSQQDYINKRVNESMAKKNGQSGSPNISNDQQDYISKRVAQSMEKKRQNEAANQGAVQSTASQPASTPVRKQLIGGKFVRHSLGDDVLPTGKTKISERMQRYEAAQAAQTRADMAQREYDDYVASADYQAYLQEQRVNQARQSAMLMPNAQPMVPGVEAKNPGGADPRVDKAKELKAKAGYYAAEAQKARDTQILWDDMEELETWPEEDKAALEMYVVQKNQELDTIAKGLPYRSAEEQSAGLISKYGVEKVRQMAESFSRKQNAEISQTIQNQAAQFADEKPFWSSVASVGANALGNFSGITGYATEAGGRTGRYSTMDPNNLGTVPGAAAAAIRGKVAQKISGDQYDEYGNLISDGGSLRQAGATLYEAGMSAADNLARMALGGKASLGLAATGSFGQTMKEASARGASPGQAVLLATASAGLEVLTEKVSLDNLLKQAAAGKKSAKEIVKNMLIQGGVEISEEEMSFLGNLLADAAIMREKSGYSQHIGQLMAQGMKYEDAKEQASKALWEEAANTAVISGLSGGMMSGGTSVLTNTVQGVSDWAAEQAEALGRKQTVDLEEIEDEEVPGLSLPTPGVTVQTKENVSRKLVSQAGRLSKATGREIVFYTADATENGIENGFFKDGKIYINTKSKNPIAQIVSHELTHSVEFADAYRDLSQTVFDQIQRMGADLQTLRRQKAALYERNGHALADRTAVDQEIVAEFVEQYLLTNEQMILDVANNNRTLGQRVLGWIDNLLAKLGDERAQERKFLNNARNLWAKALEQSRSGQIQQQTTQAVVARNKTVQSQQTAQTEESDGGAAELLEWARGEFAAGRMTDEEFDSIMDIVIQQDEMEGGWVEFSYAGVNARNADLKALNAAQQMEKQGVANETIRQQTGWFKGMDGKWRFEVDDSSARISDEVSNYMTLGQLLKDADILKEYPNLEDVSVVFQSLDPGVNASYNAQFDTIDVNYNLKNDREALLGAVLHEVQHVVQRWEGFTKGSTVGAWDRKIKAGFDSRRGADIRQEREASQELRRIQEENPEFYRDMMQLHDMLPDSPRGEVDFDTLEQISEDPPEWQAYDARLEELEAIYGDTTVWDFNHLLYTQERASNREGRTATELYWDTAGEIEARDVAARRNLDAEGRKKTPPRLGDEDTVFSDETGIAFDQDISEYPYNMQTVIRDYIDAVDKDVLSFIEEVQTGVAWPGKRVTVGKVSAKMAQKITELTGVENNEGNPIILNSGTVEHILKRHGAKGEADRSMRNNLDIARINYVLQNFDAAELSGKKSFGYRNRNGSPSQNVIFSKKINGTYFVIEAVPDTGKTGIVSAFISKIGASQVLDDNAPSSDVRNVPASTPNKSLADTNESVKQFSISATDKRGIASDLRSILSRGGNTVELRRYIENLERSGGRAEQTGRNAEQSGAQRIIQAARRSGIGVEEYLRQNWEQYDVDGEWNEDARAALDMERQGRRYSISEADEETGTETTEETEKKTAEQIREEMPAKAKSYLAGAEKKLLDGLSQKLGVSKFQNREQLQEIVREIADEYLTEGRIRDEKLDFLFDRAYAEGVVQDWSFYNEHKEIKDHLKTTGVTLSKQDQADIADFNDFRKRAFNTVKIVNNGLPVDSAYHELHELAPGLFPESITHPADQLVRMYEVGQSIRVAEMGLQKFYGEDAENHRQWARYNFDDTVNEVIQDLRSVRRVAEEAARKQAEAKAPTTAEEAAEYYKQLKDARKTYEKARAKNLLTESDEIQVGRLLRGEILPEHLDPENDNIRAITNVFEAKQEYERLTKLIAEYKAHIRAQRREAADKILESAPEWKDKKVGIAYSRETMERNIYDIVPDQDVAEQVNEAYFRPVHDAEANAVRFKNEHRDLVRKLDLSRKVSKGNLVSEAHAVQLLGEAEDNIRVLQNSRGRMKQRDGKTIQEWQAVIDDMWAQSPGLDQAKIRRAVAEFRKIYDKLFQQMNEVRIRNGYEPVNYRQGYFPHFQPGDGDGVLAHFGKVLGIDTQVAALPTTINGLTHTFRPGIQWFGNAQERLGFNTAYDAVEGFDKYLEGVSSVIFQTDNIQNLRALESQIRYRTTDEGIRKQVDAVNADTRLTEEEKQIKINSIYEHGRYTLSNFVVELTEYTNLLANKKSKLDRTMEGLIGRRLYTIMKNWESRVGANMIAGNISSAMTNFIPITQASAQLSSDSMIRGMWGTLKSYKEDDGIPGMSTFLTNRRGSDPLVKTWAQTASEKMGMNLLMNLVDGFTSDTIVRAAYYQNLKNGLSEAEAMHQADIFAASVMADRSKGSMPTLFESTNPVFKMFTQFQLEVNNQFSEIFKDLPRRHREKGLAVMMGVLLKYFIGAFLYNELYEFFAGRRPALDPLSMLNNAVGDMTGYELPNVIEWISGDADFETQKVGAGQAAKNLASTALGELPFSSGLTLLGIETDGGRLPASSAIPDLTALWDAATTEGWSSEKRWKEAKDELGKLMYVVPPFGGNQIQKTWKGVKAYMEGGSYNVDKDGNDILQYPVFKSNPEDAFWNLVRASFLGKSSLPEAQDWVDSGFDSLGSKQTAAYQDMVDASVNDRDAYALLRELEGAAKTETKSRNTVQREILAASKVSDVGKAIVYYGVLADDAEKGFMDKLADAGIDQGEIGRVAMELKNANTLKDKDKKVAQMNAVANAKMSEEEKKLLVGKVVGYDLQTESGNPTEYAKFLSAYDRGLSADEYMKMRAEGADIDDFLEVTDAGVSSDTAVKYAMSMVEMAAKEDTSKLDKWRLSVNFSNKASDQLALLSLVMTDAQFAKVDKANTFGVKPSTYVELQEILPKFDANGNGTYTQKEAKAAIDSMNISTAEKAVLWQLMNAGWKARNNPFDKKIGQQIEDSMGE